MNDKLVALTFDDGPSNVTENVLDVLENEKIVGTFFLIGNQITENMIDTLKRELSLGCEIANHSYTHSDMSIMDEQVIKDEISKTSALIKKYLNVEPKFFRPPYISLSDTMYASISLPFISGYGCEDWDSNVLADERIEKVLSQVKDGSIILLHDLENNHETVKALPVIIDKLRKDGYSFVTVSELFEKKNINPNVQNKIWSNVFE